MFAIILNLIGGAVSKPKTPPPPPPPPKPAISTIGVVILGTIAIGSLILIIR